MSLPLIPEQATMSLLPLLLNSAVIKAIVLLLFFIDKAASSPLLPSLISGARLSPMEDKTHVDWPISSRRC